MIKNKKFFIILFHFTFFSIFLKTTDILSPIIVTETMQVFKIKHKKNEYTLFIKDLDCFGNERFYKELWRKNTNNRIKTPEAILYSYTYKNEKDFEIAKNIGI
ncbi:MAG: hypothetical protein ACXWL2_04750 [Candidatus Chromulinivorax sp.]